MPRPKPLDWLVLAGLVIAWGSAFGALKIAVHDISPVWNTVIRLWVATATLTVVLLINRAALPPLWPKPHPAWGYYAAIGTIGLAAPFFLFAYAAKGIPSAVNAICNGASPIFTAALAFAVLRDEPLGPRRVGGVLIGFVGLVVLVAPRLSEGMGLEALALIAALIGALCYAVANIVTR
ncbi:MAG TPA: DMT family transporter, partial [Caulobacteraceae bacterium]